MSEYASFVEKREMRLLTEGKRSYLDDRITIENNSDCLVIYPDFTTGNRDNVYRGETITLEYKKGDEFLPFSLLNIVVGDKNIQYFTTGKATIELPKTKNDETGLIFILDKETFGHCFFPTIPYRNN